MKNKLTLILIWLLIVTPSLVNGYNPTNEELRGALFDYIGTQSRRQQYQDILDAQNKSYDQLFDSYYQSTNNLENELNYKLKELEMKEDAEKRDAAWQKEKQLLDRELELIRKEEALRAQQKSFEINKNSQDLVQYMQGVTDQIIKDGESKEKSEIKNTTTERIKTPREVKPFEYYDESPGLPEYKSAITTTQPQAIDEPAPKKNAFSRFFTKIFSFFK